MVMAETGMVTIQGGTKACVTIGEGSRTAHEGRAITIQVQRPAHHNIQDELETDHTQTQWLKLRTSGVHGNKAGLDLELGRDLLDVIS